MFFPVVRGSSHSKNILATAILTPTLLFLRMSLTIHRLTYCFVLSITCLTTMLVMSSRLGDKTQDV